MACDVYDLCACSLCGECVAYVASTCDMCGTFNVHRGMLGKDHKSWCSLCMGSDFFIYFLFYVIFRAGPKGPCCPLESI